MQTEKIISLLKNPQSISKKQTLVLKEIIEVFPYFQAARVLYLKGLKKQNSFLYNQALKKTAAYTTNRTVLFDFITSDNFYYEKDSKKKTAELNQIEVVDLELVVSKEKEIQPKENKEFIQKEKAKEILEIGKPIHFDKNEAFSFNQWLQLSENKHEILRKKGKIDSNLVKKSTKKGNEKISFEKNSNKNTTKKLELIEKFLEKKPKIKPVKKSATIDIAKDSVKNNNSLMTETLARVYVEQKKYDKAIQAFRILSLKYPEKSSFFADRIKAVEFLKNN